MLATHVRFLAAPDITDAHVLHLAGFVSWQFVPVGQNISSQGSIGWSYIIIVKGAALVSAVDEQGRLRPRNIAPQMYQYGTTSLFEGQFREATVRAVEAQAINGQPAPAGTEVLLLDRRDLQFAFAERPDLWHDGISLFDYFKAQQAKRPHEWLLDGEIVMWQGRPHAFWLLGPELITVGTLALLLWALLFLLPVDPAMGLTLLVLFVFGLLPSGWVLVNYLNDYYAVTNRRVTRRDKRPFLWEARIDAPLEMVQDVTVTSGLAGRLFNFGDLTVRTAARGSSIKFDNVPEPDIVRRAILEQRSGALAGARGYSKESLRRAMMRDLSMTLPVPDADYTRALQPDARPPVQFQGWERFQRWLQGRRQPRPLPVPRRGAPRWVKRLASPLPDPVQKWLFGRPVPPPKPVTGQLIWRKHPLNLLQRGALGFLALLVLLAALLFAFSGGIAQANLFGFFLIWFVLLVIAGAYTWWHVEDWRNDLYVLTEDRIIDIEEKPLGFSTTRRESTLDRVQTVTYRQPTFWANLFSYGDVVILTAGSDDGFTFNMVGRPAAVQTIIYQRLEAYRRRQDERRQQDTERALLDGIDVYHELGGPEPTRLW